MSIPTDNTPPSAVPSIVDTLDPDLAMAYRSGNPTIMNAVAAGMTTTAMVVNEIIRMGGALNGLPPGVQALVNERKAAMDEQAAAENARLAKLAAATVGAGLMATNIPAEAGDGSAAAEKTAYEARVMQTYAEKGNTGDYWRNDFIQLLRSDPAMADKVLGAEEKKAQDQKQQMTEFLSVDAAAARMEAFLLANKDDQELMKHLNSPEADLLCFREGAAWLEKNSDKYYDYQLRFSDLQQARLLEDLKQQGYAGDAAKHPAIVLMEKREEIIRQMREEQDPTKKEELAKQYADFRDQNKQFFELTEKGDLSKAAALAVDMDKSGQKLYAQAAASANGPDVAAVEMQRQQANTQQVTVDTQVAKAELRAPMQADEYAEDTSARKPSIAASNLGSGPDSKLAQLGALPEAANDPKAPAVEPERPRVASLSQGMGA